MYRKIAAILIVFLLLTGCAAKTPSGPQESSTPPGTPAAGTPAPTLAATPAQNTPNVNATTPILVKGLLIGGLDKGEWLHYEKFFLDGVVDFDGFVYDVYVDDKSAGQATGGPPRNYLTGQPFKPEEDIRDLADVHLYDEDQADVAYDIALSGDWELYPRAYTEQDTDQEEYLASAKDLLAQEGLTDPVTALKQVIMVDLDGDGVDETLFTADNMEGDQFVQVKKGDNALLVFRRMIDGQPVDRIVDSYIVEEDPGYVTPYRLLYAVQSCADLDGDGMLEVVVKSWYYEGVTYSIYKLAGDTLDLVAYNGAGL